MTVTVPTGATEYLVKYDADEEIVDWLGYDRDLETYDYSPSTHIPFFAATNIVGEDTPGIAGTSQDLLFTGLPSGMTASNFAVKASSSESTTVTPTTKHPWSIGGSAVNWLTP